MSVARKTIFIVCQTRSGLNLHEEQEREREKTRNLYAVFLHSGEMGTFLGM
jgi:hypothetical protein